MATISLRDYFSEINSLIDAAGYNEAIFHCTNILTSYPKCAEVYRLLGRALLEAGRTSESMDVFIKLLSVIPDDFSAHAGLSDIFERNQQYDKAIWHMERAFESQPSNVLVQEELRKLYTARDGIPPAKIRLTRGALVRMYAKGELYQQAISEALSLLEGDSERQDIKVLLAKMYHLAGFTLEAAEACSDILNQLPYCYEANLIMREIELLRSDNVVDSLYSSRLAEIDPYFALVDTQHPSPLDVPSDAIILDKLQYEAVETEGDVPDWARQIGLGWSGSSQGSHISGGGLPETKSTGEEVFTFLPEIQAEGSSALSTTGEVPEEKIESIDEELPDWISKAGWIRASEKETPPPLDVVPATGSTQEGGEPATPAEDLPDWLKNFNPKPQTEGSLAAENNLPNLTDSDLSKLSSLTTDDIDRILGDITESDLEKEHAQYESDDIPADVTNLEEQNTIAPMSSEAEIPDLPEWLRDLETSETLPSDRIDTASDWLSVENEKNLEGQTLIQNTPIPPAETQAFDTDSLESISSTVSESVNEDLQPSERSLDESKLKMEQSVNEPDTLPSEVLPIPNLDEEKTVKHEVPSWVQKILGSAEVITPVISPEEKNKEIEAVEDVDTLISDLPGEPTEEGAISDEVNLELMSWLEDITPDDILENQPTSEIADHGDQLISSQNDSSPVDNSEISLERLTDPRQSLTNEKEFENPVLNQGNQIPGVEESTVIEIRDRLSSLLDDDMLPSAEEISRIEPLPPSQISSSETSAVNTPERATILDSEVIHLLEEKRFEEIEELISEEPVSSGLLQQVYDKALSLSNEEPESFDLWKTIGDIGLKKSDLEQALEAYRKAEEILFHK